MSTPSGEEDGCRTAEEIDRSPPIGVFLSAESFFQCARKLHEAYESEELPLRFTAPIYYLYCHALELVLKSFLRAKGLSGNELRSKKFGHQLEKLWQECLSQGLKPAMTRSDIISDAIQILDPFATAYEFRYIEVGFRCLPTLDTVQSVAHDLFAIIRPCVETVGGLTPDRG